MTAEKSAFISVIVLNYLFIVLLIVLFIYLFFYCILLNKCSLAEH